MSLFIGTGYSMKTCSYCGRENDEAATHCRECGTELVEAETKSSNPKGKPQFVPGLCIVLLGLVIAGFGFGLPILLAKLHVQGKISVSFMTLMVASLVMVYGAAVTFVGVERANGSMKLLSWLAFIGAIVLSIFLFNFLDDFGYRYK